MISSGGDRRVGAASEGECLHAARKAKLVKAARVIGNRGNGRGAGRVGEVYDLDAVICKGGDSRVGAACDGEGVHAGRVVKRGEGGVGEAADGRGAGRVGEVYDLDAVICKGGDRRVGAACDGEDVHESCAFKHRVGRSVGDAGDGGGFGRVGEVYDLDAIICTGGDRRVGSASVGEGVHIPCAAKHEGSVGEAGGGGGAGRVGEVDYLDAGIYIGGDHRVCVASVGEGIHIRWTAKPGECGVGEAGGGGGAGRVGEVDYLDGVV